MKSFGRIIEQRRIKHQQEKEEFLGIIKEIISNKKVQHMKNFTHHSDTSCFLHSMHVAYYNYKICKLLKLDAVAGAKGGMLHDLFLYDWHIYARETGEYFHGMTHPKKAWHNARKEFEISHLEKDMIINHMWPLTVALPKHKETYVIVFTDKFCSVCEVIDGYVRQFAI